MILSLEQLHDRYQAGIRRDQQAQSKRKFRDPNRHDPLKGLYVLYVWRKRGTMQWLLAGFAWLKPTPVRVRRWRKRLRIQPAEVMRVVELNIAWETGAGGPPVLRRVQPQDRRKPVPVPIITIEQVRKVVAHVSHSRCDYGKGLPKVKKCTHRAPWSVSYRTPRSVGRPILKHRCTKHAWHDRYFPRIAFDFVRVEREVVK